VKIFGSNMNQVKGIISKAEEVFLEADIQIQLSGTSEHTLWYIVHIQRAREAHKKLHAAFRDQMERQPTAAEN
jgi:aspartokinase